MLKDIDEDWEDLQDWLSRPVQERAAVMTKLMEFSLKPGQRMDRTVVSQRMLHSINLKE